MMALRRRTTMGKRHPLQSIPTRRALAAGTLLALIAATAPANPIPAGEPPMPHHGQASATPPDAKRLLELPLGDPARRERQVQLTPGGIVDTRRGDVLSPTDLASRLAPVRLLFMGEDHTSMEVHRAQLQLIEALHAAGRQVVVALEMYPWERQAVLDQWVAGDLDDDAFLEASGWYDTWGYRWEYYRDIFRFARQENLPLVAVNAPRELVKRVRLEGLAALGATLAPADRMHLPPAVDLDSAEYRRLFAAYMGVDASSHGDAGLDGLFSAQCTWDAVMGWNARRALDAHPGEETLVVVLLGAGHVAYGLGAPRQVAGSLDPRALATVMPVPVGARGTVKVQASYGDFLWGLPPAGPPLYPELGISLAGPPAPDTRRIIQVTPGSPADQAGIRAGDHVQQINGRPVTRAADLRRGMAGTAWGDQVSLAISRPSPDGSGATSRDLTVIVKLTRPDPGRKESP